MLERCLHAYSVHSEDSESIRDLRGEKRALDEGNCNFGRPFYVEEMVRLTSEGYAERKC